MDAIRCYCNFSGTGKLAVRGNLLSLNNFKVDITCPNFYYLFSSFTALTDASNLYIPYITISTSDGDISDRKWNFPRYRGLFYDLTNLQTIRFDTPIWQLDQTIAYQDIPTSGIVYLKKSLANSWKTWNNPFKTWKIKYFN